MSVKYIDKKRFLIEKYKKIGLTERQLIILLICIDTDAIFRIDYDKIMQIMELNPEAVTKELSPLFQSNLLSVTLSNVDGKHVEIIDSGKLFVEKEEVDSINIFAELEHCFGKSLSSKEVETISKWISVNKYEYSDILDAFGIAAINNVRNINYIEKILENKSASEEVTPLSMKYNWLEE